MTLTTTLRLWLGGSSRGSVAVMAGVLMPVLMGAVTLAVDVNMWLLQHHRLRVAVDAAAYTAALQLSNTTMTAGGASAFSTLVSNEINAVVGNRLIGTLATPAVSLGAGNTRITVTLTSTASTYFAGVFQTAAPTITVSATAGLVPAPGCVIALNPTATTSLYVGDTAGSGSITATGCSVIANSTSSSAISLDSGSITAAGISTSGNVVQTGGGNTLSPRPVTGASAAADPYAKLSAPTVGACTYTNASFTAYKSTPYAFASGTVFCGTTTIGGNGSSDIFAPGIYVFTGPTTFQNANVTNAAGVTFVLTGSSASSDAPSLTFANNSAMSLSAPTSASNGGIPGVLIWQTCPSPNPAGAGGDVNGLINFNNGSPVSASGAIYAPCGTVQLENNARLTASSGSAMSVVASEISVSQSAAIAAAAISGGSGGRAVALLQ